MDSTKDRLARVAASVVAHDLQGYNFRISSVATSHRGSQVEIANACVALRPLVDWLEGELSVTVQVVGGPETPLDLIVDTTGTGLSLSRMKRDVTVGMLRERLQIVARLLVDQAPELLACAEPEDSPRVP